MLIALGTRAGRHATIPLWGGGEVQQVHDYLRTGASPATIGQLDFTYPALAQAEPGRDNGGWADTHVFYAAVVDPKQARVAARLNDGTPLLLDQPLGQGHVLLFASALDNLTNDLPLHPVFVTFVDHAARYLSGSERLSASRLVGDLVPLRADAQPSARSPTSRSSIQRGEKAARFHLLILQHGRLRWLARRASGAGLQKALQSMREAGGKSLIIEGLEKVRRARSKHGADGPLVLCSDGLATPAGGGHPGQTFTTLRRTLERLARAGSPMAWLHPTSGRALADWIPRLCHSLKITRLEAPTKAR